MLPIMSLKKSDNLRAVLLKTTQPINAMNNSTKYFNIVVQCDTAAARRRIIPN